MAKEVEYKFIPTHPEDIPNGFKHQPRKLSQGYIHIEKTKQVRVRLDWLQRKAWMCVKYMDGNVRDEFETEMDFQEGCELFALCRYKLSKQRSSIAHGAYHLDIDTYEDGTIVVEVEIKYPKDNSRDEDVKEIMSTFPFLQENVDGQWKYNNYNFAGLKEEDYK